MNNKINIEYISLSDLVIWPRNPKYHNSGGIQNSIEQFGFNDPVAVNDHEGARFVLEGHGRIEALSKRKASGLPPPTNVIEKDGEWLVPSIRLHLPLAKAEAYAIAHNQLTMSPDPISGEIWDKDLLSDILTDVSADEMDIDLDALGWNQDELSTIMSVKELAEEREFPEDHREKADDLVLKWGVENGQIWRVGKYHRVGCFDNRNREDLLRVMGGGVNVMGSSISWSPILHMS